MPYGKIAETIGVTRKTISLDIRFLVNDSQKYLNDMARQTLPFMYRQSTEGMLQILVECWARYRLDGNMLALKIALDCRKEIFNHAANGVSVIAVKNFTERANSLGILIVD